MNTLTRSYVQLFWKMVHTHGKGLDPDDAFQEVAMGFHRAVLKYDPEKARLSTYCYHWIKAFLQRYRRLEKDQFKATRSSWAQAALVRITRHMMKTGNSVSETLGDDKFMESLSKDVGRPVEDLIRLQAVLRWEQREDLGDEDRPPHQLFIDRHTPEDAYDIQWRASRRELVVRMLLGALPARERYIILRRRMLPGGHPSLVKEGDSLEMVGTDMGLTRERVRQLELRAMKKMAEMAEGMTEDDLYTVAALRARVRELEGSLAGMAESYEILTETVLPPGVSAGAVRGAFGTEPKRAQRLLQQRLPDDPTTTDLPEIEVRERPTRAAGAGKTAGGAPR